MISLHANLEIAKRGMQTSQLAMNVLSSNIANVNTPGYSRRRPAIREGRGIDTGVGYLGSGSEVANIRRVRDSILDGLYRRHQSDVGRWSGVEDYLSKVETLMNEPGLGGLSDVMGEFWTSWEDLSNEPESAAVRSQVRLRGEALCDSFQRLDSHLRGLQTSLGDDIETLVGQVNEMSARLAEVNTMIRESELAGHEASGLRDERDLLLDQLSEVANLQVEESPDGMAIIMLGSQVLVQGGTARRIECPTGTPSRSGAYTFVWEGTDREVSVESGLLKGYLAARNEHIASYISDLDALAQGFVTQINAAHSSGYGLDGSTGTDFFDPGKVTAADISIDSDILGNLDLIAASAGGLVGDGQNALAIANLKSVSTMSGSSITFDAFYNTLVGRVGLECKEAVSMREAEELLVLDVENQRAAISGVSLDEEMAHLISYQHAYEAMVQVAGTIDEMLADLIAVLG